MAQIFTQAKFTGYPERAEDKVRRVLASPVVELISDRLIEAEEEAGTSMFLPSRIVFDLWLRRDGQDDYRWEADDRFQWETWDGVHVARGIEWHRVNGEVILLDLCEWNSNRTGGFLRYCMSELPDQHEPTLNHLVVFDEDGDLGSLCPIFPGEHHLKK